MSALLHIGPLKGIQGGRGALYAEFVANPETAPYLVSSTRSVLWVNHLSTQRTLRAAFRKNVTPDQLFKEVVECVTAEGVRRNWGNVHPLTREGIQACVDHLAYYDFAEVDLLAGLDVDQNLLDQFEHEFRRAAWLPATAVVVVPTDRSFLGFFGHAGEGHSIVVVHNASRGMAVAGLV